MIAKIKQQGVDVGITLRPATPLGDIESLLSKVDLVLVMTVNPGFGGQKFMQEQVEKINQLAQWRATREDYNYLIQVDGGVSGETKKYLNSADVLVAGSFIFKDPAKYPDAIQELRKKND